MNLYENINFEEFFPSIFIYKDVISNYEKIIEDCNSRNEWLDGGVISPSGNNLLDEDFRIAKYMSLPINFSNPSEWFELAKVMWNLGNHYANINNIRFSEMEQLRIIKYPKYTGKYKAHYDSCPSALRIFSCVLYLNSINTGGDTFFPKFNTSVKPEAGSAVFFPSNYAYLHESRLCEDQEKYIIVTQFKEQIGD